MLQASARPLEFFPYCENKCGWIAHIEIHQAPFIPRVGFFISECLTLSGSLLNEPEGRCYAQPWVTDIWYSRQLICGGKLTDELEKTNVGGLLIVGFHCFSFYNTIYSV